MTRPAIDLAPLRNALAVLVEAQQFWQAEPQQSVLRRHLRSAVIQSFEFTYELSVRNLRRVLIERAASADSLIDLSFADLLRRAADAGLLSDPIAWRQWRELRNMTSHAYDEATAQEVAVRAGAFATQAAELLAAMESAG